MKAIITGGSRGIGRAIAEELANENYNLLLVARDISYLARTVKAIQSRIKVSIDYFKCDLRNLTDIDALYKYCKHNKFIPNLLVHNAGIFLEGSLMHSRIKDFEETMAVNVRGMCYMTRLFVPMLEKQNNPRIIIIGSTIGTKPFAAGAIYGVSKWATHGYAINLREELKECGISVTLISPGRTLTDMWKGTKLPDDYFILPSDIGKLVQTAVSLNKYTVVENIVVRPLKSLHDKFETMGKDG